MRSVDRYVSTGGGGKRLIKGQTIKGHANKNRNGYIYVSFCRNSKHYSRKVHRLVAEAFIQNPENKPMVNHVNCDVSDNRVENLEWATARENVAWMYKLGRDVKTERPLKATNIKTGAVQYFTGSMDAARHGFSRASIWRQMKGEYSHHKGYVFEYAEEGEE